MNIHVINLSCCAVKAFQRVALLESCFCCPASALTRSEKSRWVFLDSFLSDISCLLHDFPIKILAMSYILTLESIPRCKERAFFSLLPLNFSHTNDHWKWLYTRLYANGHFKKVKAPHISYKENHEDDSDMLMILSSLEFYMRTFIHVNKNEKSFYTPKKR